MIVFRYRKTALFVCAAAALATAHTTHAWEKLEGCKLLPNQSNDGDSFHVEHEGKEYIFRLYFVDAPETSRTIESRVDEQAAHFGVSQRAVMRAGKKAEEFTAKALRGKFKVVTRFEDAMGASRMKRDYAIVTTRDGVDLAMLLAENGLARAFGKAPRLAGVPTERQYKLAEDRARRQRIGVYGEQAYGTDGDAESVSTKTGTGSSAARSESDAPAERIAAGAEPAGRLPVEAELVGSIADQILATDRSSIPQDAPESPRASKNESSAGKESESNSGRKVSLNKATRVELESLPEVGPALAEAIIAARPYSGVADIERVPGIGPKKMKAILPLLAE